MGPVVNQIDFAIALKTAVHTLEIGKRSDDCCVCYPYLVADRNCRQRILHIVQAGQIKHDLELASLAIHPYHRREVHLSFAMTDIGSTNLRRIR